MANTASAEKRARQAEKHRQHNQALRSRMRTYVKKVRAAIASGAKDDAQAAYREAVPYIDGMVTKGLLHGNAAARYKSRMNAQIKALA
ncbi:MAG: 30S ribosomal protein S20 [Chromatiales bacterium]|nr:30S ribosomal protein S20 [Chromatiales bacterium]